jgi:hypothetical protein
MNIESNGQGNGRGNGQGNGRVSLRTVTNDTSGPDLKNLFAMYDKIPANQCVSYREPTLGQWDETVLSKNYFSKENIQIVQNGIRAGVFNKSNSQYVVAPQDCESLKVIMRSVFLQHSTNKPNNIAQQIADLNQIVLDYSIFHVYSEAQGYIKYLSDVSSLAVPLDAPMLTTQHDKRNYKMPTWF